MSKSCIICKKFNTCTSKIVSTYDKSGYIPNESACDKLGYCRQFESSVPPLGVMPFETFLTLRVLELQRALKEYKEFNKCVTYSPIMEEWQKELYFWEQMHKINIFKEE